MEDEELSLEAWWAAECSDAVAEGFGNDLSWARNNNDFPVSGDHLYRTALT